MGKKWQGEVHIDAPVSEVYRFLADFSRHAEWDASVTRLELVEKGDANGIGDHWRTYEKLDTFQSDRGRKPLLQLHGNVGVAVREVRELVPNKRVAWHAYPVPRMGITADCSFDLEEENGGTRLTETVQINALNVLESFGKFVFKSLDAKQTGQWEENLQAIKRAVESGAPAVVTS